MAIAIFDFKLPHGHVSSIDEKVWKIRMKMFFTHFPVINQGLGQVSKKVLYEQVTCDLKTLSERHPKVFKNRKYSKIC